MARQCVFVEVEVDTETGQVEVTKLVHPYDVGQSMNPDVKRSAAVRRVLIPAWASPQLRPSITTRVPESG